MFNFDGLSSSKLVAKFFLDETFVHLEFADRLIVAIEQGGSAGTALNVID